MILLFLISASTALAITPTNKLTWKQNLSTKKSYILTRGGGDEENSSEEEVKTTTTTTTTSTTVGPNAPLPGVVRRTFPTFPWHRLPNLLTYFRCLSIPVIVYLFYKPDAHTATSILFAVSSITDWLDGYLARRWDIASPFGAFLDPVADKLAVATSLILLAGRYGKPIAIPTSIILGREIAVTALREWMATQGARSVVKVGFQGKLKTAATMIAITLLLGIKDSSQKVYLPGLAFLYLCTVVTVTSGSAYFRAAAPILFGKE